MAQWKAALQEEETAHIVDEPTTGTKRKAVSLSSGVSVTLDSILYSSFQDVSVSEAEIRSMYDRGQLPKVGPSICSIRFRTPTHSCSPVEK